MTGGEKSPDQGANLKHRISYLKKSLNADTVKSHQNAASTKRSVRTLTSSTAAKSGNSNLPSVKSEQQFQLTSRDNDDVCFDFLDSMLDLFPKKSKVGMKHEQHSDAQRIDLIYDLVHHDMPPNELTSLHQINYNTIRNIKSLYFEQVGETYKHLRMYSDINNVTLKVAIWKDPTLASQVEIKSQAKNSKAWSPEVCSLYLFDNHDDEGNQDLKVFHLPDREGDGELMDQATEENDDGMAEVDEPKNHYKASDSIIQQVDTDKEVDNALKRAQKNITNRSYLKRRNVNFFQGTLAFLNYRDNICDS